MTAIQTMLMACTNATLAPVDDSVYVGDIDIHGEVFALFAANKKAVISKQWKTSNTATSGAGSLNDGQWNTERMSYEPEEHPAAKYCIEYRGGGFDDWYMPSRDELTLLYSVKTSLGADFPVSGTYHASTESDASRSVTVSLLFGTVSSIGKISAYNVIPMRRVPVL